jgi:hypothetical protein
VPQQQQQQQQHVEPSQVAPHSDFGQPPQEQEVQYEPIDPNTGLPPGWIWQQDAEGNVFYANTNTGVTQWEPPQPMPLAMPPQPLLVEPGHTVPSAPSESAGTSAPYADQSAPPTSAHDFFGGPPNDVNASDFFGGGSAVEPVGSLDGGEVVGSVPTSFDGSLSSDVTSGFASDNVAQQHHDDEDVDGGEGRYLGEDDADLEEEDVDGGDDDGDEDDDDEEDEDETELDSEDEDDDDESSTDTGSSPSESVSSSPAQSYSKSVSSSAPPSAPTSVSPSPLQTYPGIKVGSQVEVRDSGGEWFQGEVMSMEAFGAPRVKANGFDSAFLWDEVRPLNRLNNSMNSTGIDGHNTPSPSELAQALADAKIVEDVHGDDDTSYNDDEVNSVPVDSDGMLAEETPSFNEGAEIPPAPIPTIDTAPPATAAADLFGASDTSSDPFAAYMGTAPSTPVVGSHTAEPSSDFHQDASFTNDANNPVEGAPLTAVAPNPDASGSMFAPAPSSQSAADALFAADAPDPFASVAPDQASFQQEPQQLQTQQAQPNDYGAPVAAPAPVVPQTPWHELIDPTHQVGDGVYFFMSNKEKVLCRASCLFTHNLSLLLRCSLSWLQIPYYFNEITSESVWEPPPDYLAAIAAANEANAAAAAAAAAAPQALAGFEDGTSSAAMGSFAAAGVPPSANSAGAAAPYAAPAAPAVWNPSNVNSSSGSEPRVFNPVAGSNRSGGIGSGDGGPVDSATLEAFPGPLTPTTDPELVCVMGRFGNVFCLHAIVLFSIFVCAKHILVYILGNFLVYYTRFICLVHYLFACGSFAISSASSSSNKVRAWVAADLSSTLAQHSPDSPEAILAQLLQIAVSPAALTSPDDMDPNASADSAAPASSSSSSSKLGGGLLSVLGRTVGGGGSSSSAQASSSASSMPGGLRSTNPADPNSPESRMVDLLAQVIHYRKKLLWAASLFSGSFLVFLGYEAISHTIEAL